MSDQTPDERSGTATAAHDEIEELLAAYALRSLSETDVAAAERALTDHVPGCPSCREALAAYMDLSGELALSASAIEPPELLWARIRKSVAGGDGVTSPRRHGWRSARLTSFSAAAGIIAFVVVSGVAVWMGVRASDEADLRSRLANVLDTVQAGGEAQPLEGSAGAADGGLVEVTTPDRQRFSLYGSDVPPPAPGYVYRLWLGSETTWDLAGEFVPEDGWVVLTITIDPSRHDRVAICEEPAASPATSPGPVRWSTTFGT
jgi:hypothetical protein